MKNLPLKTALIAALIAILAAVLYPPKDSLRLGKDLAGGTSLTYTIDLTGVENPDETVDRMIQVLKQRVNPRGLYEISFVRQGEDLMNISMPLPTDQVREAKASYDAAVEELAAFDVDAAAIQRALRGEGAAQVDAVRGLMDTPEREALLEPLLEAVEEAVAVEAAYRSAESDGDVGEEELDRLLAAASRARQAVDDARTLVLSRSVSEQRIRDAMQRSGQSIVVRDPDEPEPVSLPSPRELAIEAIRGQIEELPGAEERLDAVVEEYVAFESVRRGLDDPADLQRILQGSGVLEFRIAPKPSSFDASPLTEAEEEDLREQLIERGPEGVESDRYVWVPIQKAESWIENSADRLRRLNEDPAAYFASYGSESGYVVERRDGTLYMLVSNRPGERLTRAEGGGEWAVSGAFRSTDQLGRPSIGFQMDAIGADLLSDLTSNNVGRSMAVILDNEIYTAPNIQSRISDNGQITGTFSQREINDIINTLAAGSLSAKLSEEPISIVTIAPELGAENLQRGLIAGVVALIAVAIFMMVYYFKHGVIAVLALIANAIIILGVMSLSRAAFTLPGIAGVVLTFGMAVDANVLIFERIREELLAGQDLKAAVRLGYQKVLSTIVDANVTNLIVCFVLAYTATEEVKGFAITLGIGVVSTMFTALVVSRVMYTWLIDRFGVRTMTQLPMRVGLLQRAFEPNVNWIGLRFVFRFVSIGLVAFGIGMIYIQGEEMLDNEFRGGSAITVKLKEGETLSRNEAEERLQEKVEALPEDDPLRDLLLADLVGLNPDPATNESDEWQVRTVVGRDSERVRDAALDLVTSAYADLILAKPALAFEGSDAPDAASAPVFRILEPVLGENLPGAASGYQNDVTAYDDRGGAILLRNIRVAGSDVRPTRVSLVDRLDVARNQEQFASSALKRPWELVVLEGSDAAVETAVVLIRDQAANVFDEDDFLQSMGEEEWEIVRAALVQSQTLAGVQSFSSEIAANFRGQAIIAVLLSFLLILIYIWARFGSVRYSLAAITALVHDVLIAIGLIALAEILYEHVPFLVAIGLEPYKIDLALVAAILTIVGYSLNDTIVILDRIRENRGRLAYASKKVINLSINQTISRTIITSGTTLIALIVLFVEGGSALSSFTYALIGGVIVGTYSSIAVAAPLVYTPKIPEAARKFTRYSDERPGGGGDEPRELGPGAGGA